MGPYDDPHIRDILLPYARAHLTTDYVEYTEQGVEQILLETLASVPLADATSFLLPTDPFEALAKHLDSLDLTPYQERWSVPQGAIELIRDVFPPLAELRSEKCCLELQNDPYDKLSELYRPMSPVLTQRARRETPKLGCTGVLASIPRTRSSLQGHLILKPVPDEVITELPTPDINDVLDVRYKMDAATQANVRFLLQAISKPHENASDGLHVANFLRSESPTRQISLLDSPPLFPRDSGTDNQLTRKHGNILPTLEHAAEQVIEEEEGGLHGQHMEVVNGWCAYVVSSPPSYHSDSSSNNDVDELWDMSPPQSPPTSLAAEKMEEIEIPRTRIFGRGNESHRNAIADVVGKSAGSFITSVISSTRVPAAKTYRASPLSPANSMLGQPPSTTTGHDHIVDVKVPPVIDAVADVDSEADLDATLTKICALPRDSVAYILEERLDEKDVLLMDVPTLRPPTKRPGTLFPQRMANLLASERGSKVVTGAVEEKTAGMPPFLDPVKGLKALSLNLSWVPFKFGRSIPTDEEVARVDGTLDVVDAGTTGAIHAVNDREDGVGAANVLRGFEGLGASPTPMCRQSKDEEVEYVLSRWERDRIAGGEPDKEVRSEDRETDGKKDERAEMNQCNEELDEPQAVEDSDVNPCLDADQRPECAAPRVTTANAGGIRCIEGPFSDDPSSYDVGYGDHCWGETDDADMENINPFGGVHGDGTTHGTEFHPQFLSQSPPGTPHPEGPMDSVGFVFHAPENVMHSFVEERQHVGGTNPENRSSNHMPGISRDEINSARATKRRKLDRLVPTSARDLFATFIGLRNKGIVPLPTSSPDRPETPHMQAPLVLAESPPRTAPDEVINQNTVLLPPHWIDATTTHRYMASLSMIQRRAIVQELQGDACRVILVERYSLEGGDIIVDPGRAIIFAPLFALPAQIEVLAERISGESWRYDEILVVFEAYPSARSYRANDKSGDRGGLGLNAYTPPILKAIRRLRRIVSIAEGCRTKDNKCSVIWAFANTIEEAARVVRCFGEEACARAVQGGADVLWGEREWLEEEEMEGEADLAEADGMNAFAAFVMLYGRTLEDVLDMSPESRAEEFAALVGQKRVERLNRTLGQRMLELGSEI
ncbi:hypothetical protein F5J12DRAFT_913681 [Pisolithus orientalis]|uniref:uncharacterized protein n=1 Tax=Pisolithus orientalis TaxID=936130 RepID=UPI002224B578|nr:uncharacterized protein F5J12DRAFT_913681 [Pisolithus orientalis]KAI6003453.1 hypothetical protein F5J12DRAFT_913681 [Pisolithus orientalis]